MNLLYSSSKYIAVGGAFLITSEKYKAAGLENESFYGWGPEDGERHQRWKALGYKIYRSEGCLFHLSHPRDINGGVGVSAYSIEFKTHTIDALLSLTKEELDEYVKTLCGSLTP